MIILVVQIVKIALWQIRTSLDCFHIHRMHSNSQGFLTREGIGGQCELVIRFEYNFYSFVYVFLSHFAVFSLFDTSAKHVLLEVSRHKNIPRYVQCFLLPNPLKLLTGPCLIFRLKKRRIVSCSSKMSSSFVAFHLFLAS